MYEKTRERHGDRLLTVYADRANDVAAAFEAVAAGRDAHVAIVDGDRRIDYRALEQAAEAVAAGLAARGIGPGDRVAVLLPNCAEAVITVLAVARLGAILVPIGMNLRLPEIRYIFEDAAPAAVVFDASRTAELPAPEAAGPPVERRFRVAGRDGYDGASEGASVSAGVDAVGIEGAAAGANAGAGAGASQCFAALAGHAGPAPRPAIGEDDPFAILYTSGTTGKPKGAVLSHLNVVHSALHWREVHWLAPDEIAVLAIPWNHVAGLCGVLLPILAVGGTLVMMREFRAASFLDLAEAEHITHALLVPAMYGLCLLEPSLRERDLSRWRLGVFGGAPMPEATISRFSEVAPHLVMCNAYGATETASPATIMPLGEGATHLDSIGRTVPCGDIVVIGEDGRELPPGEAGELWIGGPMIVSGYWNNPEATARSFVSGYWLSGDIGSIDAEGFVRILDRKKDMVNRGGYKVYPAEVENHLVAHPDVVEAAVVGRPDDILTERVVAFVRSKSPLLSTDALAAHCEDAMAEYKVPDFFVIGQEPLPRNANGKIQKQPLRDAARTLPADTMRSRRSR